MRALLIALAFTTSLQAQTWTRNENGASRTITYKTNATLLGVTTPVTVRFYCNPVRTKDSTGVIGFELDIRRFNEIRQFHWHDFEGPNAPAAERKLLEAATKSFKRRAWTAGWQAVGGGFGIEVTRIFDEKDNMPRDLFRSLSRADEETLRITVTDTRDANVKLTLDVPVAGRRADFAWLIAGLPKPR